MASERYLPRYFRKLLAEMRQFLTGQQIVTAMLLALSAVFYQYRSGKLTRAAFKENIASVIYPFIWVVCGFGCYYVVKAAIHLHREMNEAVGSYKPTISGYTPKKPSWLPGVVTTSCGIVVFALLSYGTFVVAFPRTKATAVTPPAPIPALMPTQKPPMPPPLRVRPQESPTTSGTSIDNLTKLGWSVIADPNNETRFNFQQSSRPLPDMHKSAEYLGKIRYRFTVGIIGVTSLEGLSVLSTLRQMDGLIIAGRDISDLNELKTMHFISSLELNGVPARDLAPVGSLVQLRELKMLQLPNRFLDIRPLEKLVNLQKLTIIQFLVQDLSALRGMTSLRYLDLTATPVSDVSPLRDVQTLEELRIDQRSAPGLTTLASGHLKRLHIIHADGIPDPIELSPVADLKTLETLDITPARLLTLTPLRSLSNLSELIITGTAVSFQDLKNYSVHLQDPAAIAELHNLKKLGLAWVDIQDTDCLEGLRGLEQIYINQTPVSDIRTLGTLVSLRSVQLAGTRVVDIAPLLNLTMLKTLIIQETPARLDVITELKRRGVIIK